MPSGRTHDQITRWTLPPIAVGAWLYTGNFWSTLLVSASYFFSATCFNGDLDTVSKPYFRWGWLRFIWVPYQKIMPHRSVFSHGPILGTLIRLAYLWLWWLLLQQFLDAAQVPYHRWGMQLWMWGIHRQLWDTNLRYPFGFCLLAGLELGALSHTIADHTGSIFKGMFKSKPPRKRSH